MNILAAVDKTFAGADNLSPKKTTPKISKLKINGDNNDEFYSKFLKDINDKDKKIGNSTSKNFKRDHSNSNILFIAGKSSGKLSSRKNLDKSLDLGHKKDEEVEASRTSLLNPRKLKKDKNSTGSHNMILQIPGLTNSSNNKKEGTKSHTRKSININMKCLREEDEQTNNNFTSNVNIVPDIMMSNVSNMNIVKILIPQSDKLKELDEELREEEKKLVLQSNIIQFEILGKPMQRCFIFDSLKIQKLNSIKDLCPNKPEDLRQSLVILNKLNKKTEKKTKPKEQQIIIINQNQNNNDFNNYSSESIPVPDRSKKKKKKKLLCCLAVN